MLKPGTFINLQNKVIESDAFRSVSFCAQAAYLRFLCRYNGRNNGNIVMSSRMLSEMLRCGNTSAFRAIQELINADLIEAVTVGRYGNRKASTYRILQYKCDMTGMKAGAPSTVKYECAK